MKMTKDAFKRDKRRRQEKTTVKTSSRLATTLFWGGLTFASLIFAGYSSQSSDFASKSVFINTRIDPVTTASVIPQGNNPLGQQIRENDRQVNEYRQRVETLIASIERIRSDHKIVATRVAELDKQLANLRNQTSNSEIDGIEETNTDDLITFSIEEDSGSGLDEPEERLVPIIAPQQRLPAEISIESNPRQVSVNTITIPKTVDPKPLKKPSETLEAEERVTQIVKKPEKPERQEPITVIDPTVVSSIAPADLATTRFGIDLGVNPTPERARDLWNSLKSTQPALLTEIGPQYVATQEKDGQVRLLAGPYDNAADAIRTCVALRISKSFCKTTLFP